MTSAARELAAGNDVEAGAHAGEQATKCEIGIRLHNVALQGVTRAAGGLELR